MISIVIPLYNKHGTIERTVKSIRSQSVADWELIIVDDGSSDDGPEFVRRVKDPRIRLVSQANAGVSAARNKGVELASSDVVTFVDADDFWDSEHLSNLEQLTKRIPDASIFATAYFMVGDTGKIRRMRQYDEDATPTWAIMPDYFASALAGDPPIHSSAVAVNKMAFMKIGGFPVGVKAGEDIITWARLACTGKVAYSTLATAYYVTRLISVERNHADIRRPQIPDYVGKELARLSSEHSQFGTSIKLYCANWHRMRAILFMELNERKNSIMELAEAMHIGGIRWRDMAHFILLSLSAEARAKILAHWRQRQTYYAGIKLE